MYYWNYELDILVLSSLNYLEVVLAVRFSYRAAELFLPVQQPSLANCSDRLDSHLSYAVWESLVNGTSVP